MTVAPSGAPTPSVFQGRPAWLGRTVLALGLVSLLADVSSEMIFPLLPVFLTEVLRAPVTWMGIVEGAGDATAAVLKLAGGWLADRAPRKKPLALLGYAISSVARPLMALCVAPWQVALVRTQDRVGKGLRTSPRDAILAASAPAESRAAAFGFHRAMDHGGALLGGLLATVLVALGVELRTIFAWAALPGALAVLALAFMAREPETSPQPAPVAPRPALPSPMRRFALVKALMAAGGRSDALLLLRAREVGAEASLLPLIWVGLHVARAASSVPGGLLAARLGNSPTAALGWAVAGASWLLLGEVDTLPLVLLAVALFGVHAGLSEGPERALVAELSPAQAHGRAYGVYHLADGLTVLPAYALTAWMWERYGAATAVIWGASLAALAAAILPRIAKAPYPARSDAE